MNFKEATDRLIGGSSHSDIAEVMGVSVASVRQYRLSPKSKAYRTPPLNWRDSIIRMSEIQIMKHRKIIDDLRSEL